MNKTIEIIIITSVFLFLPVPVMSVPMPVGVGGLVLINNTPANGLSVSIENEKTGVVYVKTVNERGYYACGLPAKDGDKIIISAYYNGNTYTNSTYVDVSRLTQWLNLSISSEENENPTPPATPLPPPPEPKQNQTETPILPTAYFTYSPSYPKINETVSFKDASIKGDADISSWIWTIDNTQLQQKDINYIFTTIGNYVVTLNITDLNGCPSEYSTTIPVKGDNANGTIYISVTVITATANQTVYVYSNDELYDVINTNESGVANVTLPKDNYAFVYEDETITTNKNDKIIFTSASEPIITDDMIQKNEGFDFLLIVEIVAIVAIVLAFYVFWRYYY